MYPKDHGEDDHVLKIMDRMSNMQRMWSQGLFFYPVGKKRGSEVQERPATDVQAQFSGLELKFHKNCVWTISS